MILASATAEAATVSTAVENASRPAEQKSQTWAVATIWAEAFPTASARVSALERPDTVACALPSPEHCPTTSATASAMAEATLETRSLMGTLPPPTSLHANSASSTTACHAATRVFFVACC